MKFLLDQTSLSGQSAIVVEPEAYDGVPPVDRLLFDRKLQSPNSDVLAVSAFLAFESYCSGRLTFPQAISPELANAIERFCDPVWVQPDPVEFEPRGAPMGNGQALLSITPFESRSLSNVWGEPRNASIRILDSSHWSGSIISIDELFVGSNAYIVSRLGPEPSRALPHIAVALLFMEPFRCNTLVVPDSVDISPLLWDRLAILLRACKLRLVRDVCMP